MEDHLPGTQGYLPVGTPSLLRWREWWGPEGEAGVSVGWQAECLGGPKVGVSRNGPGQMGRLLTLLKNKGFRAKTVNVWINWVQKQRFSTEECSKTNRAVGL